MGIALLYKPTDPVSPALQDEIFDAALVLADGRNWQGCEGPFFAVDEDDEEQFFGFSKLNLSGEKPGDVEGLPNGNLKDLLDILCQLSQRFGVNWDLSDDYGDLGVIRNGICDEETRVQIEVLSEVLDELDWD